MHRLGIQIKTLSPVVISAASNSTLMTESHDEISGAAIRGVLAVRYLAENKIQAAYADKNFLELFYGGLKFLAATPTISGKRSYKLPLSLQRGKNGTPEEKIVLDLLREKPMRGFKNLRGYGLIDGGKILTASVRKNIFMHMSRSEELERISGKSEEGHIYNYEALEDGQIFSGEILGAETDLKRLQLENAKFVAYVGRSRFTQYGKCEFTFGAIEPVRPLKFGEKIYLRLESPLISAQDNFVSAETILQSEVVGKLGKFELGQIYAAGVEVENFIGAWGMKRPRVQALAAGSIFELIPAQPLTSAEQKILAEKLYVGVGTRTEEGFGQLRIWDATKLSIADSAEIKIPKPEKFSAQTLVIAKKILREKFLEQVRIYANEDAENLRAQLQRGKFTHFFSRLENILTSADKLNVRKSFSAAVSAASKDGSLFQDNLKNLNANGQNLYDIFTESAKLPYELRNLQADIGGDLDKISDEINFNRAEIENEICLEYLRSYIRAARKIAADSKGGDDL